jgi:hypothetical protein
MGEFVTLWDSQNTDVSRESSQNLDFGILLGTSQDNLENIWEMLGNRSLYSVGLGHVWDMVGTLFETCLQ